ncbi:glycosyltransferase family 4 protein [Cytobacillus firmus]|uniref:Glycosyltransferase family 4 protein n=1 Tax=Cytobacillus firmus TaxID=1399 RepID=A0AA46PVM2_CYTFI|nr:glycosyltransferase family 4 protein [Cytobacillus firmus]UYG93835.1 glycosyltransferase family 4 protein [Cytobacillus firmus]
MKKKILMIHHSGLIGGGSISFFNVWKSLNKKYEVIAYVPKDPPDLNRLLTEHELNPRVFPFRLGKITYYSGGNSWLNPKFWFHLLHSLTQIPYWRKVIAYEQPDLVIVNSKVLCWMGLLFKNIKSVCFVRETVKGNPENFINRFMKRLLENFTLVSFLSKYDLEQTGLVKAQSIVSTDYLNEDKYEDTLGKGKACQQLNISDSNFNILFVGGINRLKGIDIAVQAINILKNKNICLIVAGDDKDKEITKAGIKGKIKNIQNRKSIEFFKYVNSYIEKHGLENKIKFIGIQTDMSISYSASDILIFPMKQPHQARPAFEIGVQKKPVVISNFENIREFVVDGVNGLTFDPNNPKDLAEAILKLINNQQLLKELGENNYDYTIKYHTEDYAMKILSEKIDETICK